MPGFLVLSLVLLILALLGLIEGLAHGRNLSRVPIRIHVNGTRGKSSVVRLIAGGLREAGIVTCAKTTGTLARMILPDGSEYPIFRPSGANVMEQVRIVGVAASYGSRALVVECMALQPQLQWVSESRLVRATHGVITNAREDHLDVMGPAERDVALALAATTPVKGKLFTAELSHLPVFLQAATDRGSELVAVGAREANAIPDTQMERFSYVEHKENVALALKVCENLGVSRDVAMNGMVKAPPDPGAMTISHIRFFGRYLHFVNAFAANDPDSSERIWNIVITQFPDVEKRIMIFNCRIDRASRSAQLGRACAQWQSADFYFLMGTGTYFFIRAAIGAGIPGKKIVFAERQSNSDLFEDIVEKTGSSALVVGMGNTKGQALDLVRYFANRSIRKVGATSRLRIAHRRVPQHHRGLEPEEIRPGQGRDHTIDRGSAEEGLRGQAALPR